ncbi:unnamed protein product [Closterium sp. NIES-53]
MKAQIGESCPLTSISGLPHSDEVTMASAGTYESLASCNTRSVTATFRSLAVTTAQQFVLLSQSPAIAAACGSVPRLAESAPHSLPPPTTRSLWEIPKPGRTAFSPDNAICARQSHGLSLQQLQHLIALTAASDSPRDTSSPSVFPCTSLRDGTQNRRSRRLSLDSAQRRLDAWNRASKPGVVEYSRENIRPQRRLKRSRSEPSLTSLKQKESSDSRRQAALTFATSDFRDDAVVSEARKQAFRHSLRRSRSARALGEKGTDVLWSDAMAALNWRRGRAVIYRRPEGPTPSALPAGSSSNDHRHGWDSRQQIASTASSTDPVRSGAPLLCAVNAATNAAVTSRGQPSPLCQTPLSVSVASQPSASQRLWSSASVNARVETQAANCDHDDHDHACRGERTAHPANYHGSFARMVLLTEDSYCTQTPVVTTIRNEQSRLKQQQQQQRVVRDPVRSVFAWAAEQRIASRRTKSALP